MTRITLVAAGLLSAASLLAAHASAIVPATADGNGHPYVGVYVAEWLTPGVKDRVCSGTLVAPRVFLTAAHCEVQSEGVPADEVWVSFEPEYVHGVSTLYHGTFVINPEYTGFKGQGGFSDPHDLAVIRLDEAPPLTPAVLPTAGFLSSRDLQDQRFTAVGYGRTRVDKTKGPNNIVNQSVRNVASQGFLSLQKSWLKLSMNPSKGDGGACFGDSGGPHFLGDTNLIVSTTVTGDSVCRATDTTYRLDTDSARRFLAAQGVPLP
jgi:hypothetical protein